MKWEKRFIAAGMCVVLAIGAYLVYDARTPDRIMFPEDSADIIAQYPEIIRAAEELSGEYITEINSFTLRHIETLEQQNPLALNQYQAIDRDVVDAVLRYKNIMQKGS